MDISKKYYDILGVIHDTSTRDIKKQYRKLALRYHPDRVAPSDKKHCEGRFKQIVEAYYILSDPQKRADYDRLVMAQMVHQTGREAAAPDFEWIIPEKYDPNKETEEDFAPGKLESVIDRYIADEKFKSFLKRQLDNDWVRDRFGLDLAGRVAALAFCVVYFITTVIVKYPFTSFPVDFFLVLPGLFFILYEAEYDWIEDSFMEFSVVLVIWFTFTLFFVLLLG